MQKISIDYVGGSHGQFLEFVCNKFIANLPVAQFSPFDQLGASHLRTEEYNKEKIFAAGHYSNFGQPVLKKVVRITFEHNDLLNLDSISLFRTSGQGLDNNVLEQNTYNKLNIEQYRPMLADLQQAYPFLNLSELTPDCPRYVLREFFKLGFRDPENHGLMRLQKQMIYDSTHNVFDFCYKNFYNKQMFIDKLKTLAIWAEGRLNYVLELASLHEEFLQRQQYKDAHVIANQIICSVQKQDPVSIPKLSLLQESYINAVLENMYQVEMPFHQDTYFSNTREIIKHIHDSDKKINC